MTPSLTGTDRWSRWLLAAPSGNTLSGFWWGTTALGSWVFVIVLVTSVDWIGLIGVPLGLWAGSVAIAQMLRGKFWG